jgi:Secretion system C-terminal sorting domain
VATREPRPNERQPRIYPNPSASNTTINIELEEEMGSRGELYLYNVQGQELRREKFMAREFQLEVPDLSPGVYLLKIRTDQQVIKSQLVIK